MNKKEIEMYWEILFKNGICICQECGKYMGLAPYEIEFETGKCWCQKHAK